MTAGSESGAFGRWERVGDEPYELDAALSAVRYRWSAPERLGAFSIDFQSVETPPERRFYPVEVLAAFKASDPAADYVERVCRFGTSLLPEMMAAFREHAAAPMGSTSTAGFELPPRGVLGFLLALFACRGDGHAGVTKHFKRYGDFEDTSDSIRRPRSLVPGLDHLPRREPGVSATDVIRAIQERLLHPVRRVDPGMPSASSLDVSPIRTPLDKVLVHGMFRDGSGGGAWDFEKVIEVVAPALIDGIEVESDSMYLVEHHEDYLHFLARLVARYRADAAGFREWVGRESGKGYVRLLPGFKRFDSADRDAAREKGRRFYRRVLWTAHEAMARCYCAAATWMWVSFCQSAAVW